MRLKDLWFWRNYSSNQWTHWWQKREIDFEAEFDTWKHPHRLVIRHFLSLLTWNNLMEIGFGGGANLRLIAASFKGKRLVGTEINKKAIESINKPGKFKVLEIIAVASRFALVADIVKGFNLLVNSSHIKVAHAPIFSILTFPFILSFQKFPNPKWWS